MKTIATGIVAIAIALNVYSQGSLTPPGAPAATMKTMEQIEPRIPISSIPATISQPGSYYLTTNLTAGAGEDGITISAPDVTLDLNGFTLTGSGTNSGSGIIQSSSFRNLQIHNGKLVNWAGHSKWAVSATGKNSTIEAVQVSGGFAGINSGIGARIANCSSSENISTGITGGHGSSVENCTAFFNNGHGIVGYFKSTIAGCTVYSNKVDGIYALDETTVRNCTAKYNGSDNIQVGSRCLVQHNLCTDSISGGGIFVSGNDGRIDSNMLMNGDEGLIVQGVRNLVIRNSAGGNRDNYYIYADNKVALIIEPANCAAISGDSGGGLGGIPAGRPWVNFVLGATQ